MNQAAYLETRQHFSPTTLTMIVALHAAAIATAAAWKMQVIPFKDGPIIVHTLPMDKDPPPIPKDPTAETQAANTNRVQAIEHPIIPDGQQALDFTEILTPPTDPILPPPLPSDAPPISQAAKAKGDVRSLFGAEDYPEAARRLEQTGTVRAKLEIGANGDAAAGGDRGGANR